MIIFIESNTSGTGEYFYKCCIKKKINFKFLIKSKLKYPWLKKKYYEIIDTQNQKKLEKKINFILKKNKITFILSTSDQFIITSNKLNNKFKINYENLELLKVFKDKHKCLEMLKKYKLSRRKNFIIQNKKQQIKNIKFPCIIKPNSGTGSIGVHKIKNQKDLILKVNYLLSHKIKVLLEEFVSGKEYSLEVLFVKGKIIFDQLIEKSINDEDHFVESAHLIRPKYSPKIINIKNKILNEFQRFKLNKMFLHIEFKITNKGYVEIIEVNPRLAGGFIPILIKQATKVDLISFYIDLINNNLNYKIKKKNFLEIYKILFLIPTQSKKIKLINFKNNLKKHIISKILYFDKIKKFKRYNYDFSDRLGHLIIKSKTIKTLKILEKYIRLNIRFIYK